MCGVWGLKPSFGRLSRRGTQAFSLSLDLVGPVARSVEDLAASYDALQGPDPLDPGCKAHGVQPTLNSLGDSLSGLRIGALNGYFEEHAAASAHKAIESAARSLNAVRGVTWPDAALAHAAAWITTAREAGAAHEPVLHQRAAEFEASVADRFIKGSHLPAEWHRRAQLFRRAYLDKVMALFQGWDVLIAPATPVQATLMGTDQLDLNGRVRPVHALLGLLTQPISFAGCPVVSAPLWPDGANGLPLGIQVIAAPWREDLALRVARALESSGVASAPVAEI